jgi:hypothetical protein
MQQDVEYKKDREIWEGGYCQLLWEGLLAMFRVVGQGWGFDQKIKHGYPAAYALH